MKKSALFLGAVAVAALFMSATSDSANADDRYNAAGQIQYVGRGPAAYHDYVQDVSHRRGYGYGRGFGQGCHRPGFGYPYRPPVVVVPRRPVYAPPAWGVYRPPFHYGGPAHPFGPRFGLSIGF